MALLDKLEKKYRRFGIPNLTLNLVIGQSLAYILALTERVNLDFLLLIPNRVMQGEIWRLFTFVIMPSCKNPICMFFALYLFYLMGTSLENYWGAFRYTVFLLIGYVATVIVSFFTPYYPATNLFLGGSIFLAFATFNPNFELALFFILPVKIKWLALLTWLGYFYQIGLGPWSTRFMVLASICNYLIFFSQDIVLRIRSHRWRMERQAREFSHKNDPVHRCVVCGITEKDDPGATFRYCTKCEGTPCYCNKHIHNHEHVTRQPSEQN